MQESPGVFSNLTNPENTGVLSTAVQGAGNVVGAVGNAASAVGDEINPWWKMLVESVGGAGRGIKDEMKRRLITGQPAQGNVGLPNFGASVGANVGLDVANSITPEDAAKMKRQLEILGEFISGAGKGVVGRKF
jgi:hypothetical protein